MTSLTTYVLQVWAEGDPKPPEGRVQLRKTTDAGAGDLVAGHDEGVSLAPFLYEDQEIDWTGLLETRLGKIEWLVAAGLELFQRTVRGDVSTALQHLGDTCRVILDLRNSELQKLPWELLRRGDWDYFSSVECPWLLGTAEPLKSRTEAPFEPVPASERPLRLLIVLGNDPTDLQVEGDREARALEDALHAVRDEVLVRVLERPKPSEIRDALKEFEPHIFHFIGHGKMMSNKPVLLAYSVSSQRNEPLGAEQIRRLFKARRPGEKILRPRLVVLNACNSGEEAMEGWALTDAFFGCGVGAILAMGAEIRGSAAVDFSRHLYVGLSQGLPIDVAVASARQELCFADDVRAQKYWPVPRLWVRGKPDEVVRIGGRSNGACSASAEADFVHRWSERYLASRNLFRPKSRLAALVGPPQTGKSELLKVLGETWASGGGVALYVDLGGPESSTLEHLIARTLEEVEEHVHEHGLHSAPLKDLGQASPGVQLTGSASDFLASQFRGALENVVPKPPDGDPRPLLLLIDGLEEWQRERVQDVVISKLCTHFSLPDPASRVRLAVAIPDTKLEAHQRKALGDGVPSIPVEGFRPQEWRRAAAQFIRWHRSRMDASKRDYFDLVAWGMASLEPTGEFIALAPPESSYSPQSLDSIRFFRVQRLGEPRELEGDNL